MGYIKIIMAVKLRLQRFGRKKRPFYHVVVADERAPRDGRFIERIGSYNPTTNPAIIELNVDRAVNWLQNGAQPTDTVRAILSYKGALYKNHLLNGVRKGVLSMEDADVKFAEWLDSKTGQIDSKKQKLADAKAAKDKEVLEREARIREAREKEIMLKNSPLAEEVVESESSEAGDQTEAEVSAEAVEAVEAVESGAEETVAETSEPAAEESSEEEAPAE